MVLQFVFLAWRSNKVLRVSKELAYFMEGNEQWAKFWIGNTDLREQLNLTSLPTMAYPEYEGKPVRGCHVRPILNQK